MDSRLSCSSWHRGQGPEDGRRKFKLQKNKNEDNYIHMIHTCGTSWRINTVDLKIFMLRNFCMINICVEIFVGMTPYHVNDNSVHAFS